MLIYDTLTSGGMFMANPMQSSLAQETVLITGGTGVIGSAFAAALLSAGAKVIILGRGKTIPLADSRANILASLPAATAAAPAERLRAHACDVSDETAFARVLAETSSEFSTPTILINAAGGNRGKSAFVDTDIQVFRDVLEMNLIGGLVVPIKHIVKHWIAESVEGNIINISSMAAYLPLSGVWAYGAAKAGVMNLTAGLAKEFAPHNIRVNAISPGFFVGNQNRALLYTDYDRRVLSDRGKSIIDHTPLGRFGKVEELAGTLLYLCNRSHSGFVTGVTIPVDGGYLIDNI